MMSSLSISNGLQTTSGIAASSHLLPLRKGEASFPFPFTSLISRPLAPFYNLVAQLVGFYVPKDSTRGQWLETRDGLLKMLQEIPLEKWQDLVEVACMATGHWRERFWAVVSFPVGLPAERLPRQSSERN